MYPPLYLNKFARFMIKFIRSNGAGWSGLLYLLVDLSNNLGFIQYKYLFCLVTGLKWVSSISYLKWGFQALCKSQITDLTFTCPIHNTTLPGSCIRNGTEALKSYSLDGSYIWEACVIMVASCVVYLILFFIGMRFIPQKPHEI